MVRFSTNLNWMPELLKESKALRHSDDLHGICDLGAFRIASLVE